MEWFPQIATAGFSVGGGIALIKWFLDWFGGRVDKRSEAVDKGTDRLIKVLQDQLTSALTRLDHVEAELQECRRMHNRTEQELAQLRGVVNSRGEIRQKAARIVAADKLAEKLTKTATNNSSNGHQE